MQARSNETNRFRRLPYGVESERHNRTLRITKWYLHLVTASPRVRRRGAVRHKTRLTNLRRCRSTQTCIRAGSLSSPLSLSLSLSGWGMRRVPPILLSHMLFFLSLSFFRSGTTRDVFSKPAQKNDVRAWATSEKSIGNDLTVVALVEFLAHCCDGSSPIGRARFPYRCAPRR